MASHSQTTDLPASDRRQFIYTLYPNRLEMLTAAPTAVEASVIDEHVQFLERLTKEGMVLLAGRTQTTDSSTFGIVLLESDSEAAARAIMLADPAVAKGVMTGTLYPFKVAVLSETISVRMA